MYKLIAIDLDGTLLNSYGIVSEKNKQALIEANKKGAEIVIASGRSTNSVKNIANDLGICLGDLGFYLANKIIIKSYSKNTNILNTYMRCLTWMIKY